MKPLGTIDRKSIIKAFCTWKMFTNRSIIYELRTLYNEVGDTKLMLSNKHPEFIYCVMIQ